MGFEVIKMSRSCPLRVYLHRPYIPIWTYWSCILPLIMCN